MPEDMKKPDGDAIDIKLSDGDIAINKDSKLYRWWDNYWYHYKWHTIIAIFCIVLLIFCTVPLLGKNEADITVVYCGSYWLEETAEDFSRALNRILPEDFDGDGEKYTQLVRYHVYSQKELENAEEGTVNLGYNANQLKTFNLFFSTGEASIYFLSEDMYQALLDKDPFSPLADSLGTPPDGAYDAYAVRVQDLPAYAIEPSLQRLPADTLVCLTRPFSLGNSSDPELYARSVAMFRALVLGE